MSMVNIIREGENALLTIDGEMNIFNAQQIASSINISDISSLELDLSKVSEIDSSGFQILIALQKECDKHSIKLTVKDISDSVKNLLILYRVSEQLATVKAIETGLKMQAHGGNI